ncbi:MAG: DUF4124 domain-containing protein [Deltaproteobacteria bacterium]|jgi:hypothetical protein|nr:DUF4124 domain-containing protein [Deltaproteobacteria bacterium]
MKTTVYFLVIIIMPALAQADMYKFVDKNGTVHFTHKKPEGKKGKKWK